MITGGSGVASVNPIEWDNYTVLIDAAESLDLSERCPNTVSVLPGANTSVDLTVVTDVAHSPTRSS